MLVSGYANYELSHMNDFHLDILFRNPDLATTIVFIKYFVSNYDICDIC